MPEKTGFVHLHVHTEYSPLDGIGKLDDLFATAAADGSPALANTDHGTLGGAWKAAQAARNAGIKFIPGIEAYFAIGSRFEKNSMSIPRDDATDTDDDEEGGGGRMKTKTYEHLTLLATNSIGWQNLAKMNSAASDSFWSKPRMDFDLLEEHSEGVIALTGCIGGPIAGPLTRGDVDTARTNLARLVKAMGHTPQDPRVFAEVMDHGIPAEDRANNLLVGLAAEFGVELVATNDAHYVHATDAPSHDLWLAMGTVAQRDSGRFTEELWIDEPNRFHFHGEGYHLRTEAEMRALFDHRPGFERACDNTVRIAEMVEENILPDALLRLPTYNVPDEYADAMSYLIHLVKEGAATRWGTGPLRPDRRDRLKRELATIRKLRFPDYFLMVWDVLNAARAHGIYTGGGRGSAAGSAVSYCLRIVEVDPLENGLLFERFLDESRTDPPDIDLDFDSEGQDWVFAYLAKRWGHEYVARLGALGFSRARGSVKTAASVLLDAEHRGIGAKLAKAIPVGSTIAQMLDETDQTGDSFRALMNASPENAMVVERALEVEGMAGNPSIHACGVIVSTERLAGMVPMRRERKKDWVGGWVIEWDKKDISEGDGKTGLLPLGLLKLDVLGLRNLDVVKRCVQQIELTTGEVIDPYAIDYDPSLPRVRALWDMLGQGRTAGVFQLESTGITELTEKVRPESLSELSAILALYRPGPMGMKMHEIYAARKRGFAPVDYGIFTHDPEEQKVLAAVLGDTYGTIVYQESIMQIGAAVAGFGGPMTNKLRSAVSKKDLAKITAVGEQFIADAQLEIVDESGALVKMAFKKTTADNLWAAIKESGRYSFNKCLTGDTVLQTGSNYTWTIEDLYRKLNTIDTPGPDCGECGNRPRKVRGLCEGCYAWHRKFHSAKQGLTLLAYDFEDGRIRPKRVKDVHYNGRKPVFKITLADGRSVEATGNHRFLTAAGWRHVEDLAVGESLLTDGGYEPHQYTPREYRTTIGDRSGTGRLYALGEENIGYIDGGFVALKTWTKETAETAECERPGQHQGRMERAHLDGHRTNNHPSNLEWMCVRHHKSHDYQHNGRPRRWEKGHIAVESAIVSIIPTGIQDTYDVEMDDDGHNFTANGIISHNSHSVAYGWVSRLTAYFKANWPAQYGAAILAVTKDADRRLPVLSDLRAEGLTILPPSVNDSFAASTGSTGTVRIGLTEIDGSGPELAAAIVTERETNGRFTSAADLMSRVRVSQGPGKPPLQIASNQVGPLIEAGALDEFGPRLGMMMVARALAAQPDTPIIDAEWSILERSARERKRLKGIVLSQHPLAALRDELAAYRAPNAQKPIGVRAISEEDGTDVLALGVLASWSRSPGKFGDRANFVLEGSGAQVPCVMWNKALQSLDGEPMVGSVVALRGRTKARVIEPPVSYEDTDEDDVDESAAVAEMAEPTVRTELTVFGLHLVPVPSEPRVALSTPPIPPILWPVPAATTPPVMSAALTAVVASQSPARTVKVRAASSSAPVEKAGTWVLEPTPAPITPPTAITSPRVDPMVATAVKVVDAAAGKTGPVPPAAGPGAHLDVVLIQQGARPGRLNLGELAGKYRSILTGEGLAAILSAAAGSRTGLLPADAGPDRLVVAVLDQVNGKKAHQILPLQVAGDDDAVTAHIQDMAKRNASADLPFYPVKGQLHLFEVPGAPACPYGQDPLPRAKKATEPAVSSESAAA